jgi:hypothetical protein
VSNALYSEGLKCVSLDTRDEESQGQEKRGIEENIGGKCGEAWWHGKLADEGEKKKKDEGNFVKVSDV